MYTADRGGRYAGEHYQRVLAGITPGAMLATREEARAVIFGHLGVFYNRARRHPPGAVSPEEFGRADHRPRR